MIMWDVLVIGVGGAVFGFACGALIFGAWRGRGDDYR